MYVFYWIVFYTFKILLYLFFFTSLLLICNPSKSRNVTKLIIYFNFSSGVYYLKLTLNNKMGKNITLNFSARINIL